MVFNLSVGRAWVCGVLALAVGACADEAPAPKDEGNNAANNSNNDPANNSDNNAANNSQGNNAAPGAEVCDDAQDNDRDGLRDCQDPQCADEPACRGGGRELCDDDQDNDGDGVVDCDDADCAPSPACARPELVCDDLIDDDSDGSLDCEDTDCASDAACAVVEVERACDDDQDNDGDGASDCDDTDCMNLQACRAPSEPEVCGDEIDNDEDGATDCRDADCVREPACAIPDEDCGNGQDDDLDGYADCEDVDCDEDRVCQGSAQAIPAQGGRLSLAGSLDAGDPTWTRPNADCSPRAVEDQHPWDAYELTNQSDAPQRVRVQASWAGGDGYLFAYGVPFDAGEPADLCRAGNDDANGRQASLLTDLALEPGQTLTLVATSFRKEDAIGAYTLEVMTQFSPEAACGDDQDNDQDGASDCDDPDCWRDPACVEVECADGLDGDGNGAADCDDLACVATPACLTARPIAAPGQSVFVPGSLDNNDGVWSRPSAACEPRMGSHRRDLVALRNDTGATQRLTATVVWQSGDGFLHAFGEPWDLSRLSGCLLGDDDLDDATASRVEGLELGPGEVLVLVPSTYAPDVTLGAYALTVQTLP
jgi:hypothetical protein